MCAVIFVLGYVMLRNSNVIRILTVIKCCHVHVALPLALPLGLNLLKLLAKIQRQRLSLEAEC